MIKATRISELFVPKPRSCSPIGLAIDAKIQIKLSSEYYQNISVMNSSKKLGSWNKNLSNMSSEITWTCDRINSLNQIQIDSTQQC